MFRTPKRTLGDLNAEIAAKLIAAAADIALIVDGKGIVRDVAFGNDEFPKEGFDKWVGKAWVDTVTIESRRRSRSCFATRPKRRHCAGGR